MTAVRIMSGMALLICIATGAEAQIHGLSVLDTAEPPGKGTVHIVPGTFVAESSALYGSRIGYAVTDRMLMFADLGIHDADYFDPEFLGQAGMRYSLPLDLPFDLSVRATAIPFIASYEHYVEITLGLLASKPLDTGNAWIVYGAAGLDRQWWELEVAFDALTAAYYGQDSYIDKGNRTDVLVTIGMSRRLTRGVRFFIEGANVDEYYGCTGIRFEL